MPTMASVMIANGRYGSPYSASRKRIIALSTQPPTKPEIEPYVRPMTRITNVAANPIMIEIRPPSATRVKRSRPNASVPNGCDQARRQVSARRS